MTRFQTKEQILNKKDHGIIFYYEYIYVSIERLVY